MTDKDEYPMPVTGSRDIVSAWIVFAALLLSVIVVSAVDSLWSQHVDVVAGQEAQLGSGESQPPPVNPGEFARNGSGNGRNIGHPRYTD